MTRTALLTGTVMLGYTDNQGTDLNTPMGRIVWGHPLKPKQKTSSRNGTVTKLFKDDGSPRMEVSYGLAIPAADFAASCWPAFFAEAAKMYTNGVPRDFSYKMIQEHELDKNNKPYGQRDGYAGHVVISITTELDPPGAFRYENGAYRQIGADEIKCGDYAIAGINLKVHGGESPALYVNPRSLLLCYEGDAIGGGFEVDPNQQFGAAPQMPAMPAGARMPGAAAPAGMPPAGSAMPGMAAPMAQQPQGMGMGGQPQYAPQPQGMPGNAAQGGMPGMGQPQMGAPANMAVQPNAGYAQPAAGNMPPPATDFIPGAAPQGMPGMPQR